MSDDINGNPPPENGKAEDSASAIFAAIMREAAERAKPKGSKSAVEHATPSARVSTKPTDAPAEQTREPTTLAQDDEPAFVAEKQQRIRRIATGQPYQRRNAAGLFSGFLRTIFVVCISTGLVATVLTWFTDPQFINPAVVKGLQLNDPMLLANVAAAGGTPTPVATPNWHYRIGILSGHRGKDSGAVCEDEYGYPEIQEVDINFAVAQRVVAKLKADNFAVDLLDENDPRLDNYQGTALVSIHANTCYDFGELVTGYIVAKAEARPDVGSDTLLRECVAINFGTLVPLERSFVLTVDMTNYHVFRTIHPLTPAVILEMGYMLADREVLENEPDLLAQAITNGIYCYLGVSGNVSNLSPARVDNRYLVPLLETPTPEGRR